MYAYLDNNDTVLATSTKEFQIVDIPYCVSRIDYAPEGLIAERSGLATWHKKISGDGSVITDYEVCYSLDVFKREKKDQINEHTDVMVVNGFYHDGVHFKIEPHDESNLTGLTLEMISGRDMTGAYFRAAEEDYYFKSNQDLIDVFSTGKYVISYAVQTGAVLKDAVQAATTKAEIDAIIDTRPDWVPLPDPSLMPSPSGI